MCPCVTADDIGVARAGRGGIVATSDHDAAAWRALLTIVLDSLRAVAATASLRRQPRHRLLCRTGSAASTQMAGREPHPGAVAALVLDGMGD